MKSVVNENFKIIITPQSPSLPGGGKLVAEASDFPNLTKSEKISADGKFVILDFPSKENSSFYQKFLCSAMGPIMPAPAPAPAPETTLSRISTDTGKSTKTTDVEKDLPVLLDNTEFDCQCTGKYLPPGATMLVDYKGSCKMKILYAGQTKVTAK